MGVNIPTLIFLGIKKLDVKQMPPYDMLHYQRIIYFFLFTLVMIPNIQAEILLCHFKTMSVNYF